MEPKQFVAESAATEPGDVKGLTMAISCLHFSQEQSCGTCVPCRIGSKRMMDVLERIMAGEGNPVDMAALKRLGEYMKNSSRCPHGVSTGNTLLAVTDVFQEALTYRIDSNDM